MTVKFVTGGQKALIEQAKALTNSTGFMEDARAVAAYENGFEGNPEHLRSVIVFEAFRGRAAEFHFGMANGKRLSLELIHMGVMVAFHPKLFGLERLLTRTPVDNVPAICALAKMGFRVVGFEKAALMNGGDVIVSCLERSAITAQYERPQVEPIEEPPQPQQ
jgi:hypothetical protein